jgi:hypothetical protein
VTTVRPTAEYLEVYDKACKTLADIGFDMSPCNDSYIRVPY